MVKKSVGIALRQLGSHWITKHRGVGPMHDHLSIIDPFEEKVQSVKIAGYGRGIRQPMQHWTRRKVSRKKSQSKVVFRFSHMASVCKNHHR
jgi:hypothetical protein